VSETYKPPQNLDEIHIYEIRIKGHLDDRRAAWFEGLSLIREDNGDTLLTGPVVDQAALHGLLRKVRDLGMTLISVTLTSPSRGETAQTTADAEAADAEAA
jgi:hypothetical protein